MNATQSTALYRLPQVLKLIPVGRSTWWAGVKSGKYPSPIKLGPRITCWKELDIINFINKAEESNSTGGNHV